MGSGSEIRATTMNVTLKPALEKLIEEEVKSGRSTNPDEFLDKAVYHYLVARDLGEEYSRAEIEEKISRGLAQLKRGETVDGDEFFEQLRLHGEELPVIHQRQDDLVHVERLARALWHHLEQVVIAAVERIARGTARRLVLAM